LEDNILKYSPKKIGLRSLQQVSNYEGKIINSGQHHTTIQNEFKASDWMMLSTRLIKPDGRAHKNFIDHSKLRI
jgi:hypothetical protein